MAMRAAPSLPSHHLGQPPRRPPAPPHQSLPTAIGKPRRLFNAAAPMFQLSPISNIRVRSSYLGIIKASTSGVTSRGGNEDVNEILESSQVENKGPRTMFLAKLAIALGIMSTVILLFIFSKDSAGSSFTFPLIIDGSSQSAQVASSVGFTFSVFGYRVVIPEYTPGWIYFWLLMAAACGFCISEEALNVWSFSENTPYIVSTVLWVYWGVCISDLVPFYLGKLFRKTRVSEDICTKLGISKERAASITRAVQTYGNLIGFVERFSLGVRSPTAFLAGAWGIFPDCFFAGVCFWSLFWRAIYSFPSGQGPDWSTAAIKDVGGRPWKRRCIRRSASSTPTETTTDEMASTGAEYYMPHGLILAESMDKPQINPPVQEFLFSTRSHTEAFWEIYSDSEFKFQYDARNYPGSEAITLVADDCKP